MIFDTWGRISWFLFQVRNVKENEAVPEDVHTDYTLLCKKYGLIENRAPHTWHAQVEPILENMFLEYSINELTRHVPCSFKSDDFNFILAVTCSCGEKTVYKVPLNTLEDFKCPKGESHRKVQSPKK